MAFMVSKAQPSFSDAEKVNLNNQEDKETQVHNPITSQLYLKSSSARSSPQALDKEVVLRRIRHHKYLNKVKSAFQALNESSRPPNMKQEWLDQGDAFSSP